MATGAVTASAAGGSASATAAVATSGSGLSFRAFLSDINPLQYVPVVGAVYRAVTGDEGNSTLRFVASLGTSFALGGPLGVGITVAEKITGIDPERIARSLLGRLLHHGGAAPATAAVTDSATVPTATTSNTTTAQAANRPWSAAELSAYAQSTGASLGTSSGTSSLGTSLGGQTGASPTAGGAVSADMLNAMELKRVSALYA